MKQIVELMMRLIKSELCGCALETGSQDKLNDERLNSKQKRVRALRSAFWTNKENFALCGGRFKALP